MQNVVETQGLNLTLTSGTESLHILKDVSFAIAPGEVVSVVGPSGSGKTSLLMVLGGLERASTGSVKVAGEEITTLDEDRLAIFRRQHLGIVFQNFHLIPTLTARDNVALALEIAERGSSVRETRAAADKALGAVGLTDRVTHRPNALSGGEQQRVGLARAMVTTPKLILADEPTGNLDQDTGALVIQLMFAQARENGAAVLLITHDPLLAARGDRMLRMEHGRLSEVERVA